MAKDKNQKKPSLKERLRDIKIELKKVIWPTKEELGTYTCIVVGVCAVFALAFWAIDCGCAVAIQKLLGIELSM